MIYFLEDDNNIRNFVIYALKNTGLDAEGFDHPEKFWDAMKKKKPDLLLLDIMLPGEDGISILKKIRSDSSTKEMPVIMLTAKGTEYDKVVGLDSGADDYVAKPFGTMELISRIKALLRRSGMNSDPVEYRKGALYLCPSKHIVKVDGKDVTLTFKEFELLYYLVSNKGIVLSRDKLMNEVWGTDFEGETRTVDVHIRTLRQKLGRAGEYIVTVRNVGYKAAV